MASGRILDFLRLESSAYAMAFGRWTTVGFASLRVDPVHSHDRLEFRDLQARTLVVLVTGDARVNHWMGADEKAEHGKKREDSAGEVHLKLRDLAAEICSRSSNSRDFPVDRLHAVEQLPARS